MIFMTIIQFVNGVNSVSIDFIKFLNMVGEWEGAALDDVFERSTEYSIWRFDMLTLLQQLRIFDNILTDAGITLQVMWGPGDATLAFQPSFAWSGTLPRDPGLRLTKALRLRSGTEKRQ